MKPNFTVLIMLNDLRRQRLRNKLAFYEGKVVQKDELLDERISHLEEYLLLDAMTNPSKEVRQ